MSKIWQLFPLTRVFEFFFERPETCQNGDMTGETFIKNLEMIMAERGVNASELARRLNMKPSAVTRWLSGKNVPSFVHLGPIAKALGVPVGRLFIDSDFTLSDLERERIFAALGSALHKKDGGDGEK